MQEEISFGVWLRKQRRALDLTRQAFADQVGCAEVTLRRIEAGTLKPSKELASILLEKLGIPETEWPQWISFARGLSGFPSQSIQSSKKPITNLPALLTSFIGREKEQSEVIRLINKHRLVTLTGSGGVGKTRLSIKVGEQALGNYSDGVWLVEFASILDQLLVPRTTAFAIGLREEPQRPVVDMLCDYLRKKRMLIILDNCEHLLDACAQLADTLLKHCPNLKILATSREALGILGEAIYPVPSLELPNFQQLVENFRNYESVRLFEERAQLTEMNFSLTIENASDVAKICAHLDGIPLALELAAARINTFSTKQIEEQLQESFSLLTTGNRAALPRHQTLQAAIDWSYELLLPAEQTLFRRLSVFVNGWTLEAAESVCSDVSIEPEKIQDLLIQLINKSLVIAKEEHGITRYRTLETIRQYANKKLIEAEEINMIRDRHLEYFLNLAETAEPHLIRPEQIEWLPLLDEDYENLRLALEWSLRKETAESSLKLCTALGWFWQIRCYWLEGLSWVKRALAKPAQDESESGKIARTRALYTRAQLEWQLDKDFEQTAQASLVLALEASDKKDIAIARFYVAQALSLSAEYDDKAYSLMEQSFTEFQALDELFWQARSFPYFSYLLGNLAKQTFRDLFFIALELARKAGERVSLGDTLSYYADWLFGNNQLDEARQYAEESDRLYKEIGTENSSINPLTFAGIAWVKGDLQGARLLYIETQERFTLIGTKAFSARCSTNLGLLAMEEGDLPQAQAYLEQALVLSREVAIRPHIALRLAELSNLFFLQGSLVKFKQTFKESLSLKNYFSEFHKAGILITILGSLYPQEPESSARLLGSIHHYSEQEYYYPHTPIEKRYCHRAEAHARKVLGDTAFEEAFADGQKMSLEEALDLALKTVEEM
jgi:predicted ATPase/DNA-binding XRE family transcriptional regulator